MKNPDRINRQELDQFSANILINLALINAAALAASFSFSTDTHQTFPGMPYAIGLMSAILSQLFWYADSAFDFLFGKTTDSLNEKIGIITAFIIILLSALSAACIIYGCLILLGLTTLPSILLATLISLAPLGLLVFTSIRETKSREDKKDEVDDS